MKEAFCIILDKCTIRYELVSATSAFEFPHWTDMHMQNADGYLLPAAEPTRSNLLATVAGQGGVKNNYSKGYKILV